MFEYRHNKCVGPHSPAGQNLQQNYGNKKRRGSKFFSVPIPTLRLSHCPLIRISNVKPAHVERYLTLRPEYPKHTYTQKYPHMGAHLINIYRESGAGLKITHANASVASPLYQDSNLRDLSEQAGNV